MIMKLMTDVVVLCNFVKDVCCFIVDKNFAGIWFFNISCFSLRVHEK